nr:SIS domain-containing protein [uncultured Treponema sp.]
MNNFENDCREYIIKLSTALQKIDYEAVSTVIKLLINTLNEEGTIYVFGNGGSASTASHMQNDFNRGLSEVTNKKFKFSCLSDNIPTITSIANDYSYDEIYSRQLEGRLRKHDIVIAISCSGNSKNIINAVDYAKQQGIKVIGITGFDGGQLRNRADYNLHASVNDMQISEDIHLIFNHLMMSVIKSYFNR